MSPEQLIDCNIKLVSLPAIVAQVKQMTNDTTASVANIAQTIGQGGPNKDSALLNLANNMQTPTTRGDDTV